MSGNLQLTQDIDQAKLREIIAQGCPDLDFNTLGAALIASRSAWVAAAVVVNRRTLSVMPFVRDGKMALAMLLIMFTGIGLILYAVVIMPKQRALADRIHALLERELSESTRPGRELSESTRPGRESEVAR